MLFVRSSKQPFTDQGSSSRPSKLKAKIYASTTLAPATGQTDARRVTQTPRNVEAEATACAGIALCEGRKRVVAGFEAGAIIRN